MFFYTLHISIVFVFDVVTVLNRNNYNKEWFTGEIAKLVGETVLVNVLRPNNSKIKFLVKGKYNASLPIIKTIYIGNKRQIRKAVRNLKNEDLIHCKVIKVNNKKNDII